ncbi:hypothetical protein BDW42DRAFT_181908 [Aspergillus taichungensis]|uniref:Enoyl reductase (ER) domain-containing protein n=1 Tax=Aspergillus taichungensis TaxID=482145 RepID=A0A2J5HD13_9EURO|nr:hypothetical protein BDW42DRAFT_181908 [Aspergillus taichungensis]
MLAVRLHPAPSDSKPYSPSNPAPSSALRLDKVPIPKPSRQGELLIKVMATTVIRDALSWPETYATDFAIPGHDFSGVVENVFLSPEGGSRTTQFRRGDEVFGMAHTDRGSTWAEYTIVTEDEVARKPERLTWEEAASLPLSGLTAFEALFEHARIPLPAEQGKADRKLKGQRLLITGSSGGVGIYLVQMAAMAGLHVVAASSSTARNGAFLKSLGADEVVEYACLEKERASSFDLIIDTVGGEVLCRCWSWISGNGTLISVDSSSFDFVNFHQERRIREGKEDVRALFFIVKSDGDTLANLATLAELGQLKPFVLQQFELSQAREAYDRASSNSSGHGKVVIRL